MCNSDFLDCKLKSQKFNCRFDSISWFCATLWYQKTKRQADVLISAAPCFFTGHGPVPMSLHLCNFEIQLQNYINHVVVQIFRDVFLCPAPLIPVLLSFLPLSPLGTFLFGRRWSSRRTGNIKRDSGKADVLIYAAPCCSSGHGPVPVSRFCEKYRQKCAKVRDNS